MTKLTDLKYVESELQGLESRLKEAMQLLGSLKEVQQRFKHLAEYHKNLEGRFDGKEQELGRLEKQYRERLEERQRELTRFQVSSSSTLRSFELEAQRLAALVTQRLGALQGELNAISEEVATAQRNLRNELGSENRKLRSEVESRLATYREDLTSLQADLTGLEARLHDVIKSAVEKRITPMEQTLERTQKIVSERTGKLEESNEQLQATVERLARQNMLLMGAVGFVGFLALLGLFR